MRATVNEQVKLVDKGSARVGAFGQKKTPQTITGGGIVRRR